MKIAYLDSELKGIVRDHSVYGIDCIIGALVRACIDHPYIDENTLHQIVKREWKFANKDREDN